MKQTVALLFAVLLPLPALADPADARNCAEDLSPSAKIVFQESLQSMREGGDPREAVGNQVKRLISNGTLDKDNARDVTEAAVQCMRMLRS